MFLISILKPRTALLSLMPGLIAIASIGSGQGLDSLLAAARRNNPQLKAYEFQASAARARVWQATALDPPMVGIEYMMAPTSSFPDPGRDQMEKDYFVQQMIMFPGKTLAMRSMAASNAAMMRQTYEAQARKLTRDVKAAYYMFYFTRQKKRLTDESAALWEGFVPIARRQYETGMGLRTDLLRAQTELAELENQQAEAEQELKTSAAMIEALIGQPVRDETTGVDEIYDEAPALSYAEVDTILDRSRPELQAMKYELSMDRADARSAKMGFLPDVMLQGRYKVMTGDPQRYWSLMVGLTLPLAPWSAARAVGLAAESGRRARKTELEYSDMRNMARYEAHAALDKLRSYREQIGRYERSIIPQAKQNWQSTVTAYQNGETELLMVLDAHRMQLMAQMDYHMAVMNYMTSQADLEQAVGLDMGEIRARTGR